MADKNSESASEKPGLHPGNPHRFQYDFSRLIGVCPELARFVRPNKYNVESIEFADSEAVKMLNKAILKLNYGIDHWDIPANYLCPPIPGRADYIYHMADLLALCNDGVVPTGKKVRVLDIGVGANCIYPIIGHQIFGWSFVGSDIDPIALHSAKLIVAANPSLIKAVDLRLQSRPSNIFSEILKPGELFDLSVCNPPFHSSPEEASQGTQRKLRSLASGEQPSHILNFGGQSHELWCEGGEAEFVRRMVKQSSELPECCLWFTTMVSKKSNLPGILKALQRAGAKDVRIIEMAQGQKQSRVVAWTFRTSEQISQWKKKYNPNN